MKTITGKTLIDLGYSPGKWFGEAITYANKHELSGKPLIDYLESIKPPKPIEPHVITVPYYKNIKGKTQEELDNISAVYKTMEVLMKTPTVVNGAVMPDACPTGEIGQIPVGGVVVTENAIHPSMHSADICCSVMYTNMGYAHPKDVLDAAYATTHFGGGGREEFSELPQDLLTSIKNNSFLNSSKSLDLAISNLGTQGDGNHFLFVGQLASTGETVMVTHHGSRGFGARLYKEGMRVAEKFRKRLSPNTLKRNAWIPYDTPEGHAYWGALQIIRKWTYFNHSVIHDEVVRKSKSSYTLRFWNEHNFVFKDGDLFYHAKGATPLDDKFVPDSYKGLRLIPLNMSQPILIVKGKTTESNLGFAPHGAGRNISRSAHLRKYEGKDMEQILAEETKGLDIRFFSGHPDISEFPSAYKSAEEVQKQMQEFGLGTVVDRVLPYGSIMAGDWQKDAPWRKK